MAAPAAMLAVPAAAEEAPDREREETVREGARSGMPAAGAREETDHESPDGRWRVGFLREGGAVTGVTIRPARGEDAMQTLFEAPGADACPMPCWVVCSPGADLLALRLGEGPRASRSLVFRRDGAVWRPVTLPEFRLNERRSLERRGFTERDRLEDTIGWSDARTLALEFFCNYTKGDEGDGYHERIEVRVGQDGRGRVVRTAAIQDGE